MGTNLSEKDKIYDRLQVELDKFKTLQKAAQTGLSQRSQLESQLTENQMVKDELQIMEDDETIYKLVGPVLIKQERAEARSTVDKRIDYITGEMKRLDIVLKENEDKQQNLGEEIGKLQEQYQKLGGVLAEA